MIEYAKRNLKTFAEEPLNEVDGVIFAWLTYIHFDAYKKLGRNTTIRDLYLAELFDKYTFEVAAQNETLSLLSVLAASPRFRDVKLSHFTDIVDTQKNIQFSAIVYSLSSDLHYVAFRGTDKSVIGWKEDFELSLMTSTQSQKKALSYLRKIARVLRGQFYVGGHSKGGNLAVYASANVDKAIKDRILTVYSYDGPGFMEDELKEDGFISIRSKIQKFIPQSSMIGMLFDPECDIIIVESKNIGILQHYPFSWSVDGDRFVRRDKLTIDAVALNNRVSSWLAGLDQDNRKRFIDELFKLIESTGYESFAELGDNFKQALPDLLKYFTSTDSNTQAFMLRTLHRFVLGKK